jgi:putative membrane protein
MIAETVADRRLHPGTIFLRFAKEVPSTVLAIPAGLAFMSQRGLSSILPYALIAATILALVNWLVWRRFSYGVGERDIVIEKGLLERTRRSIPFDRIQDVDIERRALARLFGLAKVKIETGGGGKDEGVLDSVTLAEAYRLRAAVRAGRTEAVAVEEAHPAETAAEERLLFEMGLGRVFLLGLFSFSLVYIAGLFAVLQTFDNLLPFDIYDPARWFGLVGEHLPQRFTVGAVVAVLMLALLLGVVAGILRTLARDYGFKLTLEGSRFRRVRGLFTHTEVVLARRRIQLAALTTGPVRRALGWQALAFQTLGASSDGSGHQTAAPLARPEEVAPIMAEAGALRMPSEDELRMVSRRHLVRALARAIGLPLLLILGACIYETAVLFLLALLPLLALGAALSRRFHRYGLADGLLFVTRGVWRQQTWIVPTGNTQALSLSRSLLQRPLGLASLAIDTAGAPAFGGPRIVDLKLADARRLQANILALGSNYSGRKSGTER